MAVTPLMKTLRLKIAAEGPMRLSDYMAACLLDPQHGYYTTRDPLGAAGDFTTAPEISQMFGEMLGLALAQSWLDQGAPAPFTLAEAGPGRGTLMADILRATRGVPGFHDAAEVLLIEASPALRKAQQALLEGHAVRWIDTVDHLPEAPLWFVANEFFDALPIRQFQRQCGGWAERCVALAEGDDGTEALKPGLAPPRPETLLAGRMEDTKDGDIVELRPAANAIAATLGARIADHGGAALIVDYGGWRSVGDTFQALQGHRMVDPFATPGEADLTAHVDFEPIARAAAPAIAAPLVGQGLFLERLGITPRAQALADRMTGDALTSHIAAHRRLTHPEEMGTLFKVLALTPVGAAPIPGTEGPGPAPA